MSEIIHIPIDIVEALDFKRNAVPQWILARAVMNLANLALMQHGIVLEVAKHNRPPETNSPDEGGGI